MVVALIQIAHEEKGFWTCGQSSARGLREDGEEVPIQTDVELGICEGTCYGDCSPVKGECCESTLLGCLVLSIGLARCAEALVTRIIQRTRIPGK